MSSATVAMCGRPWRFYCERKRDREEEEKQGKERLQVGPGRVSSVDSPQESGRRLREESWAKGGAGVGSGCCCAGLLLLLLLLSLSLFFFKQFLQTEMQEKAREFGKELG